MDAENPLVAYWLSDKNNRPLFVEMLSGVIAQRQFDFALKLVNQAPDSLTPDLPFIKIDLFLAMGSLQEAKNELAALDGSKFLQQQHNYHYFFSKIAYHEGRLEDVVRHLSDNIDILAPEGVLLKARAEYQLGLLDAAEETLSGLIQNDSFPEALGLQAMVQLDLGNSSKADELASLTLQKHSMQPDALLAKASVALNQQDAASAEFLIKQFLTQLPTSGRGWMVKGQTSLLLQQFNQSLSELNKAVQFMPEHIGTWHLLAWNYYLLKQLDNAEKAFKSALQLDNAFGESYGGLAVIAAVKGQIDECNHYMKLAFRLNKRSFSAEYAKALVEQSEGNTSGAENRVKGLLAQSSHLGGFTYAQLVTRVVESVGND